MENLKSLYCKKENMKEEMRNILREVDFLKIPTGLEQGIFEKYFDFKLNDRGLGVKSIRAAVHLESEEITFDIYGNNFNFWKKVDIPKDIFSEKEPGIRLIDFIDKKIEYISENIDLSEIRKFYNVI